MAVGGAAALLVVGGIAARAILNVLGGQRGLSGVVEDSIASGQNFIDGALATGQNFLTTCWACKAGLKNRKTVIFFTYTKQSGRAPSPGALPFVRLCSFGRPLPAAEQCRTRTSPPLLCPGKTKSPGPAASGFVLVDGTGLEPVTLLHVKQMLYQLS